MAKAIVNYRVKRLGAKYPNSGGYWKKLAVSVQSRSNAWSRDFAQAVARDARARVAKDTWDAHWSIKALKKTTHSQNQSEWRVKVGVDYGIYLEQGTRHMAAQPFFAPAIKAQKQIFVPQIRNIVKDL